MKDVKFWTFDGRDCAYIPHERMIITFKKNTPLHKREEFVKKMLERDRSALSFKSAGTVRRVSENDDLIPDTPFCLIISD